MKYIITFCLLISYVTCQAQQTKAIRSIDLNEVVIKNKQPEKLNRKVRSQHVYFDFKPTASPQYDSLYFATRFAALAEGKEITLSSVELTVLPFDTSVFELRFFLYQATATDSLLQIQTVHPADADRHHKLKIYFSDPVTLQSADFYLGYGFKVKHITEPYSYRMYCSSKGGEGAMFHFTDRGLQITQHAALPYVFPFKIFYYTH